jgi:hypothetical protein
MSDRDDKIVKLYEQGLLLRVIGERFGIRPSRVVTILRRRGFEPNRKAETRASE